MKHTVILSLTLLALSGCGSDPAAMIKKDDPAPVQQTPETPKVEEPSKESQSALVGNWLGADSSTITFKKDGTAQANDQKLQWALKDDDYIFFSSDSIQVDLCKYAITSKGTLKDPLSIILDLSCAGSGTLQYSKEKES